MLAAVSLWLNCYFTLFSLRRSLQEEEQSACHCGKYDTNDCEESCSCSTCLREVEAFVVDYGEFNFRCLAARIQSVVCHRGFCCAII